MLSTLHLRWKGHHVVGQQRRTRFHYRFWLRFQVQRCSEVKLCVDLHVVFSWGGTQVLTSFVRCCSQVRELQAAQSHIRAGQRIHNSIESGRSRLVQAIQSLSSLEEAIQEALGAKGYLTSRYIEITLRFFKQCVQQVSSRYMLIAFKKYPPRWPVGTF